jgi:protein-tyrosine phosphatase
VPATPNKGKDFYEEAGLAYIK